MTTNDSHPSPGRFRRNSHVFRSLLKLHLMFLAGLVIFPQLVSAQWNATIGAQSHDLGRQALAFLPNEIWIHAGDSITWTVAANEPHTVTFLTDGQIRPPFTVGCPGFSAGLATFDGTTAPRARFCSKVTSSPSSSRRQATLSWFACSTRT